MRNSKPRGTGSPRCSICNVTLVPSVPASGEELELTTMVGGSMGVDGRGRAPRAHTLAARYLASFKFLGAGSADGARLG